MRFGLGAAGKPGLRMGVIAVVALSAGFFTRHLWPVPPESSATVTFGPQIVDVSAPARLIVTRYLVQPKESVRKGQPIYEAYVSDATLDEAIAVIRLRQAIDEMSKANGGKETATIKQFRQKVAFSEQMMRRGGRLKMFYAPTDGLAVLMATATPDTIAAKRPVMRLARFSTLTASAEVDRDVATGARVRLTNWRPQYQGKTSVILEAYRHLEIANPGSLPLMDSGLGKDFERVEVRSLIETKNSTNGNLISVNVPPTFDIQGRARAWSLVKQTVPVSKDIEAFNKALVGRSLPNAKGMPRTISKAARTTITGYRRVAGTGGLLEITVQDPPAMLRQMAEAWWRAGIGIQADVVLGPDQPNRPEM